MADPFSGKGFIVTGAASGIGLATATFLKKRGANVMLWDMNADALTTAGEKIESPTAVVDITDLEALPAAVDSALEQVGGMLHGVINCAGVQYSGLFSDISIEQHVRTIQVNLIGSIAVAHATIDHLVKTRGSLVMMGSISSAYGPPEFTSYGASKAGVLNFHQSLHLEMEEAGVHVAVVTPLFVDTPMTSANSDPRLVQSIGSVHTADEIAKVILDGIVKRKPVIWPSWRPRMIYALTRQASFLGPTLMRLNWKNKGLARTIWSRNK